MLNCLFLITSSSHFNMFCNIPNPSCVRLYSHRVNYAFYARIRLIIDMFRVYVKDEILEDKLCAVRHLPKMLNGALIEIINQLDDLWNATEFAALHVVYVFINISELIEIIEDS